MTPFYSDSMVTLYQGDTREVMRALPAGSVHCVITSPPYMGLRSYKSDPVIWGGLRECSHVWAEQLVASDGLNDTERKYSEGSGPKVSEVTTGSRCSLCDAWLGHLGLEPTAQMFIDHLVEIFGEVKRLLRDDGVFFLNIGDSYVGSGGAHASNGRNPGISKSSIRSTVDPSATRQTKWENLKSGDMAGIPWRVAFALQDDGWYLRSAIIWHKPSVLPESVAGPRWEQHKVKVKTSVRGKETWASNAPLGNGSQGDDRLGNIDGSATWEPCPGCKECSSNDGLILRWGNWRPTKSYEMVFMFTKSDRYFADQEAVREPSLLGSVRRAAHSWNGEEYRDHPGGGHNNISKYLGTPKAVEKMIAGRNLRDVWSISPKGFDGDHFAAFPPELVRRLILAGTSEKVCSSCGAPWARVITRESRAGTGIYDLVQEPSVVGTRIAGTALRGNAGKNLVPLKSAVGGWRPTCRCDSEPAPATVLDPFVGSGTTCFVAKTLGRKGIGIDLNIHYLDLAVKRVVVEGRTINV